MTRRSLTVVAVLAAAAFVVLVVVPSLLIHV